MDRSARYSRASTNLALLSDRQLGRLLDDAEPIGSGIGGASSMLEVDGVRVFVKRVPLTDVERRPENVMSTANLFGLPTFYQYGIGSTGFGAWRELAVHTMTTNWVLANQCQSFPLMYHWRVLPGSSSAGDVESAVEYWEGSPAVRERLEAIERSSASVVLFLEYIPQRLSDWLGESGAFDRVERWLEAGTSSMNSRGLLHFDAHFNNILTDGERLYFADFGLAVSSRFELSQAESDFFATHLTYDRHYTTTHLVEWMRREGTEVPAIIERHAPIAAVMTKFYRELQTGSKTTPYPLSVDNGEFRSSPVSQYGQ